MSALYTQPRGCGNTHIVFIHGWAMAGLFAIHATLELPTGIWALALLCSFPCFVRKKGCKQAVSSEIFRPFAKYIELGFYITLERFLVLEALGSA